MPAVRRPMLVPFILLASALLSACAPATPPAATAGAPKVTASGFECPEPQPRLPVASTEFNVFVWTEYIPADILECFGLVYGLQVNREEFSSNEELFAKLQAGASGYDLVHPSDYIIAVMIRAGLLQPLQADRLPNWGNLDPAYLKLYGGRAAYIAPYQVGSAGIVYHAGRVANPPRAWADLWRPEYAGRLVLVDDSREIIGMTLLSLGYSPNTSDPAQLQAAAARLAELVPGVKLFDSDSPKTALIAGDVDLGVVWNGEAFLARREDPALTFVLPAEGAITFQDGFGIPADAAHVDAAYAWINYVLQADVGWLLLRDYPYTVPNRAALDFARQNHPDVYAAYTASSATNTPAEVLLAGQSLEDVGAALPLYDRLWTEVRAEP